MAETLYVIQSVFQGIDQQPYERKQQRKRPYKEERKGDPEHDKFRFAFSVKLLFAFFKNF